MNNRIERWSVYEIELTSIMSYANPLQDVLLTATFVSEAGEARRVDGFWDGGSAWRVRFAPPTDGRWRYSTECSDARNLGLHGRTGVFEAVSGDGEPANRFAAHGPVRVSDNRRYLVHADGTPFFYMADTGWNGPLLSTDEEWRFYVEARRQQGFTAVQWVPTQWIASPGGDRDGRLPFTGYEQIAVNPEAFQNLDRKLAQMNAAGLLGVPVLLWAADWGEPDVMKVNPGLTLPEEQAIKLARYMVARWSAYAVVWILGGDCEYRGTRADRWRRLGRSIFGGRDHAPVSLHPNGMSWHADEFRDEGWLDLLGYQGCHFGGDNAYVWAVHGPPATEWHNQPPRPIINLEPPYENHIDISDHSHRFSAEEVRRALYWSLLVSPTAGVTYGGHGVWGWDDGTKPPTAHPASGIPLAWRDALHMPAAEQIRTLASLFAPLPWWTLEPEPTLVRQQPGDMQITHHIAAARSQAGDLAVIYSPVAQPIDLDSDRLGGLKSEWFNPRSGERSPATPQPSGTFQPPAPGDWVLLFS